MKENELIEKLQDENKRLLLIIDNKKKIIDTLLFQNKELNKEMGNFRNLKIVESNHRKLNGKLREEVKELEKKLDKAIEMLIEYNIPCEMNDFMNKNVDYCMDNCSVDEEVYKKCWLRYIEQELEK